MACFNEKPKKGLQLLAENGFLPGNLDESAVARFLRATPSLSKEKIGELFGEPEPECQAVLKAFLAR